MPTRDPAALYSAPNLLTRQWQEGVVCIRNYVCFAPSNGTDMVSF